ncbi:PspC domain-containing protein [Alkalihalobacillus oceani]|uniref:PspC domain-containing protein n=1 Tax=Halalkalibacter oceani TaxID=1653776 RepID=UPI00203F959B|nr:PspC domain-containing protein [Halalkalibacter oceani]
MKKRLYRSQYNRKIAGVCGGLAEYFSIDATILRLVAVFLLIVTIGFPMVIAYVIAAVIIPNDEDVNPA